MQDLWEMVEDGSCLRVKDGNLQIGEDGVLWLNGRFSLQILNQMVDFLCKFLNKSRVPCSGCLGQ